MKEVKNLINYNIDNNFKLQEKGNMPIAICLEAEPGIGKTSIIEQVAHDRGMTYTKVSLAQMEEAGDIIGFPIKEYECQAAKRVKAEDGTVKYQMLPNTVWLNEKQLDGSDKSLVYRQTGKTRMAYSKPAWVPEYNENGCLVNLDDWSRANPQLIQAVMDLILTQGYISWKFPKKTSIFLTSNPDDGTNNVTSLDEAQSRRYLNFNITFDLDSWMRWAEETGIDGRCINFVASYSGELFESDEEGNHICNPRSFVMFANMISGIKDWDNSENLSFISLVAKGCFKDEGGRFSEMFSSFIRHKMHLLIQPKDMLVGEWKTVKEKMEKTVYDEDSGNFRPDISSLLERRFSNYVLSWLKSDEKTPIAKVKERILEFMENEEKEGLKFFTKDQFYHMLKTITSDRKSQTNKLLMEPKIAKILMS